MADKINKIEVFDVNRAIEDRQSGRLEHLVAMPDFGDAHQPHVDLNARPAGGETIKYRIYDLPGTVNLRDSFGPDGLSMP